MGCCNSKNRVRDVVDDQVVAGVNELSKKNGRKPSITDQLTTDRFIYVKPKDNNRNSEIDESKISKWNGVKLEDVSNSDFPPLDESDKSKDQTKPADQNKHLNHLEIKETESNESDKKLENESKPTIERNNDQDVDYDALYEFLFESESDEEKEIKSSDEKVKNNDQSLVGADHKNSNRSLSIEKQIEEIINELISNASSKKYYKEIKNAEFENSNNNNSIKQQEIGKNDNEKLENNDLEDKTDYDTKYDFSFELDSDEEKENKSVVNDDKVKHSSEEIKQEQYIQKPDIEGNSDDKRYEKTNSQEEEISNSNQTNNTIDKEQADLERQVEEWKSLIESLTSNSKLTNYALAKPRTEFKLVKDVGYYLSACREAKSNTEKAWLIYVWITHNIEYDAVCLQNKDYRFCKPQSVLERGLAVCAGYAELYKTLCAQLGVKCISIGGYSKGADYKAGQKVTEESHAWNAIPRMGSDGKLRFIESTWGAGHLDENKTFVKKFEPHYFAVPAHIFNESHHSESYKPTDGTKKFTLDEFDDCPNNQIGYHILGLTCVNNTMRAITRTNKNPLVIEYNTPQKIYFIAKLVEEETGREINDWIVIQSEYSSSKDQKSRYCLIADIPEKGRNYKLNLFAKNKRSSEEEDKSYRMITEFLVVREGDDENPIPRYNQTFNYDLRLKSHLSSYIKFKTNLLVMEFEDQNNNSQTSQKIYFSAKLFDIKNNIEIKNAVVVQSEYSMFKDQKSRYCMIIEIPEKWTKYKLKLYANNDDKVNTFPFLTDFILIREGDEESSIPRYNLTFDHDLRLTSHFSRYIKFKTSLLVMEFEDQNNSQTPQKIYFRTALLDIKTGLEIKNAVVVQSEYSISKDQKSKYCIIIEVPEKWTKYMLQLFSSCDNKEEKFPFLTDFILIREGDEESSIPRYNLTFDHDLRLTSHFTRYIKFKTSLLVMEFEDQNNSQTPQKIYFRTALLDIKTGLEIKNAVVVQSEYSISKDQKSKYCIIIEVPEKWTKYMLQLFSSCDNKEEKFPFLTDFILIREGDDESSIPRYNLTFDHDLRLTSHFSQYIKLKTNLLVMEFEAPNNSQTPHQQKVYIKTKLLDMKTGIEMKNAAVVQSEYAMFKDQKSRYCVIADISEKRRKYKLQVFAKNKNESEDKGNTFPFLTEFIVIREGDEESYIPQYKLSFDHDIKLKSHYCQFIKFKTNPLAMEFEVPKHIKTLFKVKTMNDSEIEDAVFSQINPENSKTILQVAIPRKGEKFLLKMYAKHDFLDQENSNYGFVSQMFLTRTRSNKNDDLRFCKIKMRGEDFFIYSPIEYYLSSNNLYEFRYYIKDALDVVLIDSSKKRIHLKRVDNEKSVWKLTSFIREKGKLTLYAKFNKNTNSYNGICYYQVD